MLLFDTHTFVWLASTPRKLSTRARHAIRSHADGLHVSSISALEIGILVKRKRLSLPLKPDVFIGRALEQHGIDEVPVDWRIAFASTRLPEIHNDPFDRIIISTAQLHALSILSLDSVIPTYPGVSVIW